VIAGKTEDKDYDVSTTQGDRLSILNGPLELLPLDDYGGGTETMPPKPGSPVIDAGSDEPGGVDQRGFPRLAGIRRDVGSVEFQDEAQELIAGFQADSDRDGVENGLELALNRNPLVFDPEPVLVLTKKQSGFFLSFRTPAIHQDLMYLRVTRNAGIQTFTEVVASDQAEPFENSNGQVKISVPQYRKSFYRLEAILR
jgi:hypothetical protein